MKDVFYNKGENFMIYKHEENKVVTTEIELLHCPFCGSENIKPIHHNGDWGYSSSEDYVMCQNCKAEGGHVIDGNCGNNLKEAIIKWNHRY